jgi:hypothetical protein
MGVKLIVFFLQHCLELTIEKTISHDQHLLNMHQATTKESMESSSLAICFGKMNRESLPKLAFHSQPSCYFSHEL